MRATSSHQRVPYSLFTILFPLVFLVAAALSVTAQCPDQTVENAVGECIFLPEEGNTVKLKKTLTLPPNTTLNCQSVRIAPTKEGTGTSLANLVRSNPQVAIFLNGAQNVKIKNCHIDKFDFGIFAINSKPDPDNRTPPIQIFDNSINARFVGISFMAVDNSEIRSNDLGLNKKGGRAIYVGRDSDRNRILDNQITVTIPIGDATPGFRVPAPQPSPSGTPLPVDIVLPSNPAVTEGSAVLVTQSEGVEPSLLNAFFEGNIFQLTITDREQPNGLFSEGNIFHGNIINIKEGFLAFEGIVLSLSQQTRVSNNKITGNRSPIGSPSGTANKTLIKVGFQTGTKPFPGKCRNSGRFCLLGSGSIPVDLDCNIPGFDTGNPDVCENATPRPISWVSYNTIIQDNIIAGPFDVAISTTGEGTIITGNTIKRREDRPISLENPITGIGIRLIARFALEGTPPLFLNPTIVTRNIVEDTDVALNLIGFIASQPGSRASTFRANISLNDFTRYTKAVTTIDYSPPGTELSSISEGILIPRGNFWGQPCSIGLAPGAVEPPNATIKDSHHFGALVAKTPGLTPCP